MSVIDISGVRGFSANPSLLKTILVYESLASTNETAKELIKSEPPNSLHGTLIVAGKQTSGKGRRGKSFSSPEGGAYMSLILEGYNNVAEAPITPAAAVAVCNAIEKTASLSANTCQIKWVNDVFLNGKKICGILTELVNEAVILGIGINVASFADYAGIYAFEREVPENFRERLIACIADEVLTWGNDSVKINEEYKKRSNVLGREVEILRAYSAENSENEIALAVDIDELGRLIVKKSNGALETLSSGEISVKL